MTVTTKKAPAAGGNQREGEDQTPYERNQIVSNPTNPTSETVEQCPEYSWCTQDHSDAEATFHEKQWEHGFLRGWFYPADDRSPARVHYMECLDWSLDTLEEIQEVADAWLWVKVEFAKFVAEVSK